MGQRFWNLLTSTRTAIALIGFIIVSAMAAGFVPQGLDPDYYRAHYGAVLGKILHRTGLTQAFTAWWFAGAQSLLFISLAACAIRRIRHFRRMAAAFPFRRTPAQMRGAAWCYVRELPDSDRQQAGAAAESLAREQGFKNLRRREGADGLQISGLRYRWAYLCSPVLHLGLALLLLGLILNPFTALNEYFEAGEGEVLILRDKGYPFDLRVKDFQIEYYDDYRPKQYTSRLAVLAGDGGERAEKVISVNHPLRHAGVKVYQSSWGWVLDGMLVSGDGGQPFSVFDGREATVGGSLTVRARFYPDLYVGLDGVPGSRTPEPCKPGILYHIQARDGVSEMGLAVPGEKITLPGAELEFTGFRYYTGLQIKMEPLLPVVFLGFGLALTGLVLFYLVRPRRLWVLVTPGETGFLVYVAGDGGGGPAKVKGVVTRRGTVKGGLDGGGS